MDGRDRRRCGSTLSDSCSWRSWWRDGAVGHEALRLWKLNTPQAFDALRDPAAYFAHIDAHYMVVSEQLAREDADRHGDRRELRFWIEQRSQSLMEMTPLPPREDTFLDVSHAGHGVAFVNGVCVGRYWNIGPQQTLYVPAPLVREGRNEVLLLDLDTRPTRLALAEGHVFGRTGG